MERSLSSLLDAAQIHSRAGRLDEAALTLEQILLQDSHHAMALEGLAYMARETGDDAKAADYFDRLLLQPQRSAAHLGDAALVNRRAERPGRAAALLEELSALMPNDPAPRLAAALSWLAAREHGKAREVLEQAVARHPGVWELHYNLGRLYGEQGLYDAEVQAYETAIRVKPDAVDAYVNLGVALRDQHQFDRAMVAFKRAVQLDDGHAGARTNRAQTNLMRGELEHGFREYEWRWKQGAQSRPFIDKAWDGKADIRGKTLLIYSEQGLGDTLQYLRFIEGLAGRGAKIVLRVQQALLSLLIDYPGTVAVVGEDAALPPYDLQCALMSLPFVLKTRLDTIPAPISYIHAKPKYVLAWQQKLLSRLDGRVAESAPAEEKHPRRPRIGIVWSGNPGHVGDAHRSTALAQWVALFDIDADFVSLQKEIRETDRATLASLIESGHLHDFSSELQTFDDTAALITSLDLVISVDSAVAHLSGALGKTVYLLLRHTADWRWLIGRADSPWYPATRLFRQKTRGDWEGVFQELADVLQAP